MDKINISDINKPYRRVSYMVNISLDFLSQWVYEKQTKFGLILKPDFQRNYVWSKNQKINYIEHLLNEGSTAKDIYFNHPNWMTTWVSEDDNPMVLVDGMQRISAIMEFLNNTFKVYDKYYAKDINGLDNICLNVYVNKLKSYTEVIEWYIELNNTGIKHTTEDINHAKNILRGLK